jgi:hypothetical protein
MRQQKQAADLRVLRAGDLGGASHRGGGGLPGLREEREAWDRQVRVRCRGGPRTVSLGRQRTQRRKARLHVQWVHLPAQEVTTIPPAAVNSEQTGHLDRSTQMQDGEDDDNDLDEGSGQGNNRKASVCDSC